MDQDAAPPDSPLPGGTAPLDDTDLPTPVSPGARPPSLIPWQRRRLIGRQRAYWSTVLYVIRRMGWLRAAGSDEVSLADARQFRTSTLGLFFLAMIAMYALTFRIEAVVSQEVRRLLFGESGVPFSVIGLLAMPFSFLVLYCASGVVSWLFAARGLSPVQKTSAMALSYYAIAPLAAAAAIVVPLSAIGIYASQDRAVAVYQCIAIINAVAVLLWMACLGICSAAVTGRRPVAAAVMSLATAISPAIITLMIAWIPLAVIAWALMFLSLM